MFRAIIFDMDGVVIDSEPSQVKAERQLFLSYGVVPTQEDWTYFVGRTTEDIMGYMVRKYRIKAAVKELVNARDALYAGKLRDSVQLMPGFRKLASQLFGAYQFAMTTSSSRKDTDVVLERFRLHDLFEAVVTADDVTRTKPEPEPYLRTAELLGLRPEQCVVIEDAVNGLISARKAGTATIGLASTFPAEKLTPHADAVAGALSEIPVLLLRLERIRARPSASLSPRCMQRG